MASISCPSCKGVIPLDDVDLSTKLAKCRPCASVFDFRDQVRSAQDDARRRRELVPPSRYRVIDEKSEVVATQSATYRDASGPASRATLRIVRRWWSFKAIFGSLLAGLWTFLMALSILHGPGDAEHAARSIVPALLFLVFPGLVGLILGLVRVLNRTSISVDDQHVRETHGPLPWRRSITTASGAIRSLVVERRPQRLPPDAKNAWFVVLADTTDDPARVIVSGLPTEAGARFVARVVSERLGLPDPL